MNKIPKDVIDEFMNLTKDGMYPYLAANYVGISRGYGYYLMNREKYGAHHREYIRKNKEKVYAYNREYARGYYRKNDGAGGKQCPSCGKSILAQSKTCSSCHLTAMNKTRKH